MAGYDESMETGGETISTAVLSVEMVDCCIQLVLKTGRKVLVDC